MECKTFVKIKRALLFGLLLISIHGFSQSASKDVEIENEVNTQLWEPFKAAFEGRDWKGFNNLHTDDVLRITKWGIKSGSEYKEHTKNRYQRKDSVSRTIDFWLEHRVYSGDIGYEVGYYKITNTAPNREIKQSYARFHIVLKKINGVWKIAQDWDESSINDIPVSVKDFEKGSVLEF